MSLVSASGFITGIKEYLFRGIQELPMVLSLTFFVFAITTGSIAHSTLLVGISVIMPLYTWISQQLMSMILTKYFSEQKANWTCSTSDTCNIVSSYKNMGKTMYFFDDIEKSHTAPSYWITSMGFFFGFIMTNAIDTLQTPMFPGADPIGHEKRNFQSMFLLVATSIFIVLLLLIRFYFMASCEGRGFLGKSIGVTFGVIAGLIGWGFYELSKVCGARSSDLFGVLSQIIPPSASAVSPTVCMSE